MGGCVSKDKNSQELNTSKTQDGDVKQSKDMRYTKDPTSSEPTSPTSVSPESVQVSINTQDQTVAARIRTASSSEYKNFINLLAFCKLPI